MSDAADALGAVLGLLLGGVLFITFGSALSNTTLLDGGPMFLDFQLWGAIYIVGALVLAVILIGGVVASLADSL